jgi:lipopolysaccharide transport system permease protein
MEKEHWDLVLKPGSKWFTFNLKELLRYKDLILLFVRRDFVAQYKQTILGPLWHLIQPLFTTFMFVLIFGNIAKIQTDGSPYVLFYMTGIIIWNFFSGCIIGTSNTFIGNASIFGKIYFPRLIVPLSTVISNFIRFLIQFILFFIVWGIYGSFIDPSVFGKFHPGMGIIFLPVILLGVGLLGLAGGIIISSMTTKYRDLSLFIGFAIQLLMYLSPVIYPSIIWEKWKWIMDLNPMSYLIESFRYAMLGTSSISYGGLAYSLGSALLLFVVGLVLFTRVEKSFMDTV